MGRRMMTYRLVALILSSHMLVALPAQERTFKWYNEKTYELYEQQRLDELIELGKEALRQDYDYFYLRMRLGWAYYQQKRYRQAARQYYRALHFSCRDPSAIELLYYSLLYGGRPQEAWLIRRQWPDGPATPFFQLRSVQGDAGVRITQQNLPVRQLEFASTGFSHQLGGRLLLQHQYYFLRQHFQEEEEVITMPSHGNGSPMSMIRRRKTVIDQQEYQLAAAFQFRRGWQIYGALHPLWYSDTTGTFNEGVVAFGIRKDWPALQLAGDIGFADLSQQTFRQYKLQATIYPLSNTTLYYRAAGIWKDGYETASYERNYWVSQQLGFRLFNNTWLEGQYSFGKATNFFEGPAAIVYNLPDPIEARYGGSLQYWIEGRHLVYLYFLQEQKIYAAENIPFHQFTVLGGLRLTFGSP